VGQCAAVTRRRVAYVADAYGTRFDVTPKSAAVTFENHVRLDPASAVLRGILPANGVARVVAIEAQPGAPELRGESGAVSVTTPVYVTGIYAGHDGAVNTASARFEVSAPLPDATPNAKLSVIAEIGREVYGVAAEGGIELRIPVEIRATELRPFAYAPITEISYDEAAPVLSAGLPSLMIARAKRGDTLWSVAKRYRATPELVREANGMEENAALRDGAMLVVPRKR
jgi:hypothetical protein